MENKTSTTTDIKKIETTISENLEFLVSNGKKLKRTKKEFKDTILSIGSILGDEETCSICDHSLHWHYVMENGKVMESTAHDAVPKIEVGISLNALDAFCEDEDGDYLTKYRLTLYGNSLAIDEEIYDKNCDVDVNTRSFEEAYSQFGSNVMEQMILENAIPKFIREIKEALEKTNKRSEKITAIANKLNEVMRGIA